MVLESSHSLRTTGYAFTTWVNAWKALDVLGVGDSLREKYQRLHGFVVTPISSGLPSVELSLEGVKGKVGNHEVRCVNRKELIATLEKELPRDTIRYSSKVVSIEESGSSKLVHLANGSILKTKVLIGCDGVNSVVAKWLGFKQPAFAGRVAIRGSAEYRGGHEFEAKFLQFLGEGFRCGFLPCDDRTMYWFFTYKSAKVKEMGDDPAQMKQFVLSKLGKVPDQVKAVVENTHLQSIISSPLVFRYPWEVLWGNICKGNACLVGDALHPMTPDLGQGGCCALEDAVVLARCLGTALMKKSVEGAKEEEQDHGVIESGLKKYAKERKWRGFDLISTGYVMGYIQEGNMGVMRFLRDKFLASFLAGLLLKKADFDCGKLCTS